MGLPTGQGKTWTAHRVSSLRRVRGIHGYRSAEKNGEWLTLRDAAAIGVSHHQVRKLIKAGILNSEQVIPVGRARRHLERIAQLFQAGAIRPPEIKLYRLSEAADAHRLYLRAHRTPRGCAHAAR
jgi:Zinc-binding dehydrogenase